MGLEEFEKELAASRESERHPSSRQHRREDDGDGRHRQHHHRHHHHHRSHRPRDDERRHRHKRHHSAGDDDDDDDEERERRHARKRRRSERGKDDDDEAAVKGVDDGDGKNEDEDEWVEKEVATVAPEQQEGVSVQVRDGDGDGDGGGQVRRDAWMQEPSGRDVDYVRRRKQKEPSSQFVGAKQSHEFAVAVPEAGVNPPAADVPRDVDSGGDDDDDGYTFGDSGSSWRLTKLHAVYRHARETNRDVDHVALERYGNLREFDEAREEEREMDRRKMYGQDYVGRERPSGKLYEERKRKAGVRREAEEEEEQDDPKHLPQGERMPELPPPQTTAPLDRTALNKLKAQLMRARLMNASNAAQLEEEYTRAEAASMANAAQPDVVVLSNQDHRGLASRSAEVHAVSGKRGRERGLVTENEDMSIEDMVRQEKRTRGARGGEGRAFAERIAKDGRFRDDLDYMDDNAQNLSKKVLQSDVNLRNTAIGDFHKTQRILDTCPLCHHEDRAGPDALPTAPLVSLATRTYLTLPTEPEVAPGGAVIVPIQHRMNLLECDDDEWEEMRNFMKSLTRHYAAQDQSVIFYENAAHMRSRKGHAALAAVPLPHHLAETAPAYFREAILASDEPWSQHPPIIDTLALARQPGTASTPPSARVCRAR
ncbi:cell cycle control protein cwf19, partial [Teratosphaeria destructans]